MSAFINAIRMLNIRELDIARSYCPQCNRERYFLQLNNSEIAIRCLSCRGSLITLSLIGVIKDIVGDLTNKSVYELSARGVFVEYLKRVCGALTCSEFFDDVEVGGYKEGVICQDVQQLTFKSKSFDICTSLEVFEHVPHDDQGFSEIHRVLNDNGIFIFTVPIDLQSNTLERAMIGQDGEIEHLAEPEYHVDPLRSHSSILAFRTYGIDIVDRLIRAGFAKAEIRKCGLLEPWGHGRAVIVAYKRIDPDGSSGVGGIVVHSAGGQPKL